MPRAKSRRDGRVVEGKGLQILPEQSARGFESRSRLEPDGIIE